MDARDQCLRRALAEGSRELTGDRRTIEWREVETDRPVVALELREPGGRGVTAVEGVRADGQDEHQPFSLEVAREEGHEITGGAVDPVKVLEHDESRCVRAQFAEEAEDELEQAGLSKAAGGPCCRG